MKHYKDPTTNEIYAYNSDGSQDEWIKPNLVLIDEKELMVLKENQRLAWDEKASTLMEDPAKKLAQFLALNPDVLALIK